jgi:hypothetical protein
MLLFIIFFTYRLSWAFLNYLFDIAIVHWFYSDMKLKVWIAIESSSKGKDRFYRISKKTEHLECSLKALKFNETRKKGKNESLKSDILADSVGLY